MGFADLAADGPLLLGMLAAALAISATVGGCAGAGNLGNVLGDVLGGMGGQQQSGQVQGTILGVDSRAQAIGLWRTLMQILSSIGKLQQNLSSTRYLNQKYGSLQP